MAHGTKLLAAAGIAVAAVACGDDEDDLSNEEWCHQKVWEAGLAVVTMDVVDRVG